MIYLFKHPYSLAINSRSIFLSFILVTSIPIFSQNLSPLAEDFLEGLPPSVREEIEVQNQVEQEEELEKLFRSDTSVEKNKVILRNLQEQLRALELRLSKDGDKDIGPLKRFGESFFQTFQSSFMPVNVPNIGSSYIVDVGDVFKFSRSGQKNDTGRDRVLFTCYGNVGI